MALRHHATHLPLDRGGSATPLYSKPPRRQHPQALVIAPKLPVPLVGRELYIGVNVSAWEFMCCKGANGAQRCATIEIGVPGAVLEFAHDVPDWRLYRSFMAEICLLLTAVANPGRSGNNTRRLRLYVFSK